MFLNENLSLNQTLLTFFLYMIQTWTTQLILTILCEGLSLIQKDSVTHMHGLAVYVKEGLPFTRAYLQKMLRIYIYVFDWFYLTYCLTSFFSIDHFLCLYSRLLMLFHLRKMRFFQPTHLLMFDFNVHQKDWITYSGGTDRPGEVLYFFLSQMTLLRRLTFLLGSLTAALRVLLF